MARAQNRQALIDADDANRDRHLPRAPVEQVLVILGFGRLDRLAVVLAIHATVLVDERGHVLPAGRRGKAHDGSRALVEEHVHEWTPERAVLLFDGTDGRVGPYLQVARIG